MFECIYMQSYIHSNMHTHGHRLPPCTKQKRGIPAPAAKHKTYICEDIRHAHKRTHTHSQRHTHTHTHTATTNNRPQAVMRARTLGRLRGRSGPCEAALLQLQFTSPISGSELANIHWSMGQLYLHQKPVCGETVCVCGGLCLFVYLFFSDMFVCVTER